MPRRCRRLTFRKFLPRNTLRENYETASFKALPALKDGMLEALIRICSPVLGLRPERSPRCFTEKVPNPTIETGSEFLRESPIAEMVASSALPASAFERPALCATSATSSDLFKVHVSFRFSGDYSQKSSFGAPNRRLYITSIVKGQSLRALKASTCTRRPYLVRELPFKGRCCLRQITNGRYEPSRLFRRLEAHAVCSSTRSRRSEWVRCHPSPRSLQRPLWKHLPSRAIHTWFRARQIP